MKLKMVCSINTRHNEKGDPMNNLTKTETEIASLKQFNQITYILYLVGYIVGFTRLVAIIMNYIKRDDMRGTWLESHVDYQIKTFWISLVGYIVGGLLAVVFIGFVIILITFIWDVYRFIKGLMALNDNKSIQA